MHSHSLCNMSLAVGEKCLYYCYWPHLLHTVHRCGLLLQMSHVAWSVCLSVCSHTGELCKKKTSEPSRCCLTGWLMLVQGCIRWGSRSPTWRGTFEGGTCRCIVPYLHVIALCIVHLPPLANVPVHTCYYYDSTCLIMSGVECSHDHDCDHHVLIVSCNGKCAQKCHTIQFSLRQKYMLPWRRYITINPSTLTLSSTT